MCELDELLQETARESKKREKIAYSFIARNVTQNKLYKVITVSAS
jgi:hypothetical protein